MIRTIPGTEKRSSTPRIPTTPTTISFWSRSRKSFCKTAHDRPFHRGTFHRVEKTHLHFGSGFFKSIFIFSCPGSSPVHQSPWMMILIPESAVSSTFFISSSSSATHPPVNFFVPLQWMKIAEPLGHSFFELKSVSIP